METINEQKFALVVEQAMTKTRDSKRWQNAIRRAAEMIQTNPFTHWTGSALLIWSDSGEIYEASKVCQCRAFTKHQPCKHRAAYRLVQRYNETSH
ncbi:MAG: hypothetical protein H0W76_26685 [Pyrinomonadaceae bacterium]|nr:hypothetical protein [Pyrinomonadaceae bacterium]